MQRLNTFHKATRWKWDWIKIALEFPSQVRKPRTKRSWEKSSELQIVWPTLLAARNWIQCNSKPFIHNSNVARYYFHEAVSIQLPCAEDVACFLHCLAFVLLKAILKTTSKFTFLIEFHTKMSKKSFETTRLRFTNRVNCLRAIQTILRLTQKSRKK